MGAACRGHEYGHSARMRIWRWPVAVAALTLFGLLAALLGQGGVWWVLSWIALAAPLLLIARYWPLRWFFEQRPRS